MRFRLLFDFLKGKQQAGSILALDKGIEPACCSLLLFICYPAFSPLLRSRLPCFSISRGISGLFISCFPGRFSLVSSTSASALKSPEAGHLLQKPRSLLVGTASSKVSLSFVSASSPVPSGSDPLIYASICSVMLFRTSSIAFRSVVSLSLHFSSF